MKITFTSRALTALGAVGLTAAFSLGSVQGREPYTQAELDKQQKALWAVSKEGYDLWHGSKPSMSTNGLGCGNCHPDGAAANPQTFPKFIPAFSFSSNYFASALLVQLLESLESWCASISRKEKI